jgi:Cation transporter/ATPase, N-terminus
MTEFYIGKLRVSSNELNIGRATMAGRGLAAAEATRRLAETGPNALPEGAPQPAGRAWVVFRGPIPWMIEVALVLSAVLRHWADTIIVGVLLVFNAGVGFWQERTAADALAYGVTAETKSGTPSLGEFAGAAIALGVVIAFGVLAASVGLIRSETAGDLRTLTATGASPTEVRVASMAASRTARSPVALNLAWSASPRLPWRLARSGSPAPGDQDRWVDHDA